MESMIIKNMKGKGSQPSLIKKGNWHGREIKNKKTAVVSFHKEIAEAVRKGKPTQAFDLFLNNRPGFSFPVGIFVIL